MSTNDSLNRPKVGVCALVLKDGKVLLGERINAHGAGTWCPPGGHLEYGETPAEGAARELLEETGLVANALVEGPWSNDIFENDEKHYITLFMIVNDFDGEVAVKEPEKCLSWQWFDSDKLPTPLFLSIENIMKTHSIAELASLSEPLETSSAN